MEYGEEMYADVEYAGISEDAPEEEIPASGILGSIDGDADA